MAASEATTEQLRAHGLSGTQQTKERPPYALEYRSAHYQNHYAHSNLLDDLWHWVCDYAHSVPSYTTYKYRSIKSRAQIHA